MGCELLDHQPLYLSDHLAITKLQATLTETSGASKSQINLPSQLEVIDDHLPCMQSAPTRLFSFALINLTNFWRLCERMVRFMGGAKLIATHTALGIARCVVQLTCIKDASSQW